MRITALSLGAGVQSTTLALMGADGTLPMPDLAIFADTGWEPKAVYDHLDRLEKALPYPVVRVNNGSIREGLMNPAARFAAIPYHTINDTTGAHGMGFRQCTSEYKLTPIRRHLRQVLGAKPPNYRSVPRGHVAVQWVGFSTDEVQRANRVKDSHGVLYLETAYPLLDLGMSRKDCERWLTARGWTTQKSACIGCPFHGNSAWRLMRDTDPESWADAILVDKTIRERDMRGLRNIPYLHRSRVPLSVAPIDKVTKGEWNERQVDLLDLIAEEGDPDGCSPYGCRSGSPV